MLPPPQRLPSLRTIETAAVTSLRNHTRARAARARFWYLILIAVLLSVGACATTDPATPPHPTTTVATTRPPQTHDPVKESGAITTGMNTLKALLAQCAAGQPSSSCDIETVVLTIHNLVDEITDAIAVSPYPAAYTNISGTIQGWKFSASTFRPGSVCQEWLFDSLPGDEAADFTCRPEWDSINETFTDLEWLMTWS